MSEVLNLLENKKITYEEFKNRFECEYNTLKNEVLTWSPDKFFKEAKRVAFYIELNKLLNTHEYLISSLFSDKYALANEIIVKITSEALFSAQGYLYDKSDEMSEIFDIAIREITGERVVEWCSFCNTEVLIPHNEESQCPNCGEHIRPCCLCDMDIVDCDKCRFN